MEMSEEVHEELTCSLRLSGLSHTRNYSMKIGTVLLESKGDRFSLSLQQVGNDLVHTFHNIKKTISKVSMMTVPVINIEVMEGGTVTLKACDNGKKFRLFGHLLDNIVKGSFNKNAYMRSFGCHNKSPHRASPTILRASSRSPLTMSNQENSRDSIRSFYPSQSCPGPRKLMSVKRKPGPLPIPNGKIARNVKHSMESTPCSSLAVGDANAQDKKNVTWHRTQSSESNDSLYGLSNLGNTCYMNATLQSLFGLETFANSLINLPGNSPPLCRSLRQLLISQLSRVGGTEQRKLLQDVKEAISSTSQRFRGHQQHDAHELLSVVLDQVTDEITKLNKEARIDFTDPTCDNFSFQVIHCFKCQGCGNEILKEEDYQDLSLVVPRGKSTEWTIQDAINIFFEKEEVEYTCCKCKHRFANVTHQFMKLPRILILHAKRYGFEGDTLLARKNHRGIMIPKYLTLAPMSHSEVQQPTSVCDPCLLRKKKQQAKAELSRRRLNFGKTEMKGDSSHRSPSPIHKPSSPGQHLASGNDAMQLPDFEELVPLETSPKINLDEFSLKNLNEEEQIDLALKKSMQDSINQDAAPQECSSSTPKAVAHSKCFVSLSKVNDVDAADVQCSAMDDEGNLSSPQNGWKRSPIGKNAHDLAALLSQHKSTMSKNKESLLNSHFLAEEFEMFGGSRDSIETTGEGEHCMVNQKGKNENQSQNEVISLNDSLEELVNWNADDSDQMKTPRNEENKENNVPGVSQEMPASLEEEERQLQDAISASLHPEYLQIEQARQLSLFGDNSETLEDTSDDAQLQQFLSRQDQADRSLQLENANSGFMQHSYQLMSVVSHLGNNSASGHYVCDVFDIHKRHWFSYDDSDVSKVEENYVLAGRRKSAYIYFYLYKDVAQKLYNFHLRSIPAGGATC